MTMISYFHGKGHNIILDVVRGVEVITTINLNHFNPISQQNQTKHWVNDTNIFQNDHIA